MLDLITTSVVKITDIEYADGTDIIVNTNGINGPRYLYISSCGISVHNSKDEFDECMRVGSFTGSLLNNRYSLLIAYDLVRLLLKGNFKDILNNYIVEWSKMFDVCEWEHDKYIKKLLLYERLWLK